MINSCDILMIIMGWLEKEGKKVFKKIAEQAKHAPVEQMEWNK